MRYSLISQNSERAHDKKGGGMEDKENMTACLGAPSSPLHQQTHAALVLWMGELMLVELVVLEVEVVQEEVVLVELEVM